MAGELKIKRSTTAGAVPSSLLDGEFAINQADKILYYKDSAGTIRAKSLLPETGGDAYLANTQTFAGANTFTQAIVAPTHNGSTLTGGSLTLNSTSHGTKGNIDFGTFWRIGSNGSLLAQSDAAYEIGAATNSRPSVINISNYIVAPRIYLGATASQRSSIFGQSVPGGGIISLFDDGGSDFKRLQFGGTTSSFPALKRTAASIDIVLADDSGYSTMQSLYDRFGTGSPEGVVTAPVSTTYKRTDGAANTTFYIKETGTGNTGWVALVTSTSGSIFKGQSTVSFASFLPEAVVTVTGQTGLLSTSAIVAQIYADNDDVYAQDWNAPIIKNIVAGTSFDIVLRPTLGDFSGNVKVNWRWS